MTSTLRFRLLLAALVTLPASDVRAQGKAVSPAPTTASSVRLEPPKQDYLLYVVAESADQVALVRFGPGGLKIERSHKVGLMPTEINGPHGISVSPDGKFYYVSVAHGTPYGT